MGVVASLEEWRVRKQIRAQGRTLRPFGTITVTLPDFLFVARAMPAGLYHITPDTEDPEDMTEPAFFLVRLDP